MTKITIVLAFAAALTLGACGKKGPLEPPPDNKETSLALTLQG